MTSPTQIAESNSQGERNENQKNLSSAAAPRFVIVEQIIEIPRGRLGINAETRIALARSRIIQPEE
jgi:hypothetical protein